MRLDCCQPRLLHRALAGLACVLAASCGGGDPASDSLVALGEGTAGAATRVDARLPALASAVAAMEERVAAMERRDAITTAAAVGTYRLLALNSKTVSGPAAMVLGSRSGINNATVTLAPNGSFTYASVERMSGFRAQIPSCSPVSDVTAPGGSQPSHQHSYTRMNCTINGFISTDRPTRDTNSGGGTWRTGPGNTLVIIPSDGAALTVYLVKGGAMGFSVSAQDESDSQSTGSFFEMMALVKQ